MNEREQSLSSEARNSPERFPNQVLDQHPNASGKPSEEPVGRASPDRADKDVPGWLESERLDLNGVVYTSVFNPFDGRKNWYDMVTAFCYALRDAHDAVLVMKFVHQEGESVSSQLVSLLYRLQPFKCRVVAFHSFLSEEAYSRLVSVTDYYVNTSHGEGQCLPLMEFLSCGKPAIAPASSALIDYLDHKVAFLVKAGREPIHWQHDPRRLYRASQSRIDWESLRDAYLESYHVAKHDHERYQALSKACVGRMRDHCSRAVVRESLCRLLETTKSIRVSPSCKRDDGEAGNQNV
jgi:glycosyltransferase involved in cell wall biosynthesis